MKKLLFFFISIVICNYAKAYDFEKDGIYYNILSDTEVEVTAPDYFTNGYGYTNSTSNCYSGNIVIPNYVGKYKVIRIGARAFCSSKKVKSVVLPETIESIGIVAFSSESLESVNLPSSLKRIENEAFSGCSSLLSIEIPASVEEIGMYAFYGCTKLASIKVPDTPLWLDYSTFKNTAWLDNQSDGPVYLGKIIYTYKGDPTSVTIKEGTLSIAAGCFYDCKNLETINIPSSVCAIGPEAFVGTKWMNNQSLPIYVNNILYKANNTAEFRVEHGTEAIAKQAFYRCSSMKSIEIPNTVKRIEPYCFEQCTALSSLLIPSSVEHIGEGITCNANSLETITVDPENDNYCSVDGILYTKDKDWLIVCPIKKYSVKQIPTSTKYIRRMAFQNCRASFIVLPASISMIDQRAFENTASLIYLPYRTHAPFGPDMTFYSYNYDVSVVNFSSDIMSTCRPGNYYTYVTDYECNAEIYAGTNKCETVSKIKDIHKYDDVPNAIIVLETSPDTWLSNGGCSLNTVVPENFMYKYYNYDTEGGMKYNIEDTYNFYCPRNMQISELTYTRNFTNTNWNALYVPFAMQYDDWSADFEVARLNDVHQFDDDEDGVIDRTVLELIKLKAGSSTEPNTPYMIKAKENGEKSIVVNDATLYATEENSFDVTSWYTDFRFTGNYNTVTDMATRGHYALANGNLVQASSDAATLSPFRWYLDITDRNGNPASLSSSRILLSFDDGVITEINTAIVDAVDNASSIYTLNGVGAGRGKSTLPMGLYISNGKKVLVK